MVLNHTKSLCVNGNIPNIKLAFVLFTVRALSLLALILTLSLYLSLTHFVRNEFSEFGAMILIHHRIYIYNVY